MVLDPGSLARPPGRLEALVGRLDLPGQRQRQRGALYFDGTGSRPPLLLPDTADQAEPALDGAEAAAELGGDLLVAVALHLVQGDALAAQGCPGARATGGTPRPPGRRRRALASGPSNCSRAASVGGRVSGARQGGLVEHGPAAPLLPALVLRQVGRLAGGEEDEELPQVQAVVQLGKAFLLDPPAEAVEGAEGDVFLVGGAARARRGASCGPDRPGGGSSAPTASGPRPGRRP